MPMLDIPLKDIDLSSTATQVARRKRFKQGELEELVGSIAEHGVLQPIIVREQLRGAKYQLVAGERRYLAAQQAELENIPAVVRDLSDEQVIEVQLIENLQRKDVHPMQEAEGYQELIEKHGHHVDELHDRVGKSRSYVYGRLKLLALCAKARKAFFDDTISASVALLIARIPGDKLQQSALRDLAGRDGQISYRRALEIIRDHYMLRLNTASFPKDDPQLNGKAGPCTTCPKRTGNQAELFADIASTDVCTDPICFRAKTKTYGDRLIAEAKADGRAVITGNPAKKIAPYEHGDYLNGYARLDGSTWDTGKQRKVRTLVGRDAEVTLLQLPKSGEVVEVVKESVLQQAIRKTNKQATGSGKLSRADAARDAKMKLEKAYRLELFSRVRPLLPAPDLRTIVGMIVRRLIHDDVKRLTAFLGLEVPSKKQSWGGESKDYAGALRKYLDGLSDSELGGFINDCNLVGELHVAHWNAESKAERLEEAAAIAGVDAKKVRREIAAKLQAKKKARKKKAGQSKKRSRKKKAA